ncbi:hypothetical protein LX90_000496 [Lentzea flava]|nr:hypothetical protein [Lentzea flava]
MLVRPSALELAGALPRGQGQLGARFAVGLARRDVPYVGKRWVNQLAEYDRDQGISYWTKNYRTGIELEDLEALNRRFP